MVTLTGMGKLDRERITNILRSTKHIISITETAVIAHPRPNVLNNF
jgi:hypothetical protein